MQSPVTLSYPSESGASFLLKGSLKSLLGEVGYMVNTYPLMEIFPGELSSEKTDSRLLRKGIKKESLVPPLRFFLRTHHQASLMMTKNV